jgi:hypothetical protein
MNLPIIKTGEVSLQDQIRFLVPAEKSKDSVVCRI